MEKIDIRDCFPVMNGGDGVILSKRGDICAGWEMSLPPAFRCNEEKYDSIISTLNAAIALLPDYSIVHKQDIYMRKKYASERAKGLLDEAYERHHKQSGRNYKVVYRSCKHLFDVGFCEIVTHYYHWQRSVKVA